MERLFTVANDSTLIALIAGARERLVILAPGFSKELAKKIAERVTAPDAPSTVAIIVDIDPEVCRLGYGEIDAVDILRSALKSRGFDLQTQPGVRIGLIVADSEIMVYSPTPQLIEAGSTTEVKPNAVRIGNQAANDLVAACGANVADAVNVAKVANAVDVARAVNVAKEANTADVTSAVNVAKVADAPNAESKSERKQEVGLTPISEEKLKETKQDLKAVPPREFNIARRERVFSYKLEFVEFSIEGFKLATRAVQLPPELLGLDEDVDQWHNTFRLFPSGSLPKVEIDAEDGKKRELGERALSAAADALRKKYLISLPGYGWLILVRNKAAFESAVETLRADLKIYKKQIDDQLNKLRTTSTDRLIELLLPRVREKIPERWSIQAIFFPLTDDDLRDRLRWDLEMAVLRASDTFMPEVKCLFKGVTYGTIKADEHFQAAIAKAFGKNAAAQLLNERDVTEAKDQAPAAPKNP